MIRKALSTLTDMCLMFRWEHDTHTNIFNRGDASLQKVDGLYRLDIPGIPASYFQDIVSAMRAEKEGEARFRMLASDGRRTSPAGSGRRRPRSSSEMAATTA
ncbi:hypothetical protein [Paracoccus beibuensis]|uniref:hypothetical protein n=1 Tax=Paracoccus beibuensis TaxID=547602 RepID=UPI00223FBAAC|nr:hypothetical protein [Paracoccus beibuensis]